MTMHASVIISSHGIFNGTQFLGIRLFCKWIGAYYAGRMLRMIGYKFGENNVETIGLYKQIIDN